MADDLAQRRKSTIRAAFGLSVIQWTCFAMEVTLFTYVAKSAGVEDVRIGYLSTTMAVCQLITNPFFSRWAGSHLKFAITVAFLSSSISFFLTAISYSFAALFVSRVAAAFAHGAVAAQTAIAASTTTDERTAMFGKLGATIGVGFTLGSAMGGATSRLLGLRVPLFVASAMSLAAALLGPRFVKVDPQSAEKKNDGDDKDGARAKTQGVRGYLRLLSSPKISTIMASKNFNMVPANIMLAVFGIYLINEFKTQPGSNAFLTVYVGLCMTAMNGGGVTFLKRYLSDRGLLLGGILAFSLTGLGLSLVSSYYHFFPIMTTLAIGMALVGSSTDSMLTTNVHGNDHALVLSLAWALDALTRVIGPTLGGYILISWGFPTFGYVQMLGALGAAGLVVLFL